MLDEWLAQPIEVIPAVDVLGDGAVRLHQGDYDEVVERAGEPVALARRFAEAGATRVHLVDLDGARSGRVRPELVRARRRGRRAGARSRRRAASARSTDAAALLAAGADRVVVGTAAFAGSRRRGSEALGERLVVALDVRDGQVRTAGWTRGRGPVARRRGRALRSRPASTRVLCTAIDRDGTLAGPDLELVRRVAASGLRVLAAAGVRSPDDVAALAEAGAEAAVVGRALLAGTDRGARGVDRHVTRLAVLASSCSASPQHRRSPRIRGRASIAACISPASRPGRPVR